jgi:hypothetical protein
VGLKRTRVLVLLSIVASAVSIWLWYAYRRDARLEDLRAKATGQKFVGSSGAMSAVRTIASDGSGEATRTLIAIATQPDGHSLPGVKKAAIEALAVRRGAEIAARLAALLQPSESLEVRSSVAQALQQQPCTPDVSSRILYYKERLEEGEWAAEDVPNFPPDVRNDLGNEKAHLSALLNSIVVRCETQTNMVLAQVYGFGTIIPSKYGMRFVRETAFRASCPLLLESADQLFRLQEKNETVAEALQATLDELKCRNGSSTVPRR